MAQFNINRRPLNTNEIGYNNQINSNLVSVIGIDNIIYSSLSFVNGNDNVIFLNDTISNVFGLNNRINGSIFNIGDDNNVEGIVFNYGNRNIIEGYIYNFGNDNNLKGLIYNFGASNSTDIGVNAYVLGNGNTLRGGLIAEDISSFTNSNPTASFEPYLSNNRLKIIGDETTTSIWSNDVVSIGNSNIIGSVSNVNLIGSNQTIDNISNQLYIGSNLDVNIKGAVLPCNLIQTYTPNNYTDPFGVSGSIIKDDNNIYVKTDGFGWREIPFNNSYGSFYDTTIQTNPTASTPNKMLINSTYTNKNVSVVSGNVYVDYDGLYNIQFSAQVEKTDSGVDNVDIWLRYNGVDVDWTNTRVNLTGNGAKQIAAWNFYQAMTASSYFTIMWSSADLNVRLYSEGTQSNPNRPSIPSVILTVDKISSI